MKAFLIVLVLIISCFASDIEGFRDMKWGDAPNKLGGSTITEKNLSEKVFVYKKDKESLSIGNTKLKGIYYSFFDNKLTSVIFTFSGEDSLYKLKEAFETKYGGFIKPNKYSEDYYLTKDNANITIQCTSAFSKCYVFITNTKLYEEESSCRKSVAKKGAKDL